MSSAAGPPPLTCWREPSADRLAVTCRLLQVTARHLEPEGGIMRRVVLVGAGFLLMLAGVIFTLQGVGVLGGSVMSGMTFWALAGPVIALAGLVLAVIGLR